MSCPAFVVRYCFAFLTDFASVYFNDAWNFVDKNSGLLMQGGIECVWDFREGFELCQMKPSQYSYAFIGKDGKFSNTPMIYPTFPINIAKDSEPAGFSEGAAVLASRANSRFRAFLGCFR